MKKKISRGRHKKKHYFTKEHERAIIQYNKSQCNKERGELYKNIIEPVFIELIDKIVHTFKFTNLHNIQLQQTECLSWLMTIIEKYDENKKSPAFSYFSVIVKNWFIHRVKKQTKRHDTMQIQDMTEFADMNYDELTIFNPYHEIMEQYEFFEAFYDEMDRWENEEWTETDKKVLFGLRKLFQESDKQEIYNKKAIYLYLREITGQESKYITPSIKKFKENYDYFRYDWYNGWE